MSPARASPPPPRFEHVAIGVCRLAGFPYGYIIANPGLRPAVSETESQRRRERLD